MPGLNKTQKEFRKQMQALKNIKTYKEMMNENDNFYHNTAYEMEILEKYYKRRKKRNTIIAFSILFCLSAAIYSNLDIIKSKISDNFKNNFTQNEILKISNNKIYTSNEIKQNKIGIYSKDFVNNIELINLKQQEILKENTNINNINTNEIENQLKIINDLIQNFENYKPDEIIFELHNLNIEILKSIKTMYENVILYKNNLNNMEYYKNYADSVIAVNYYRQKYREKLIEIFKEINMNYKILKNGTIHFEYPEI